MLQSCLQKGVAPAIAVAIGATSAAVSVLSPTSTAQAATFKSVFDVTAPSILGPTTLLTGDLTFTKTQLNSTQIGYRVQDSNASLLFLGQTYSFGSLFAPADPTAFNYVSDTDLLPVGAATYSFTAADVSNGLGAAQGLLTQLPPNTIPASITQGINLLPILFPNGGQVRLTTTEVFRPIPDPIPNFNPGTSGGSAAAPEPTTIAGLTLAGYGLAAMRRRRQKLKS